MFRGGTPAERLVSRVRWITRSTAVAVQRGSVPASAVRHHGIVPRSEPPEPAAVKGVEAEWARFTSPIRELVMLNAVVAFVLELAMLVFVAWWALLLDVPWWARILIALVLVGGLAVLWGTFASPRARVALPVVGIVAVKAIAFGSGALALWGVGGPVAAIVFAGVAAVSVAVTTVVRTRAGSEGA